MSAVPKRKLSTAEYLDSERAAAFRSEYFRGETFAMAGASKAHNTLSTNLVVEAGTRMKGGACQIWSTDQRLKIDRTGLYTYPDLVIVCGQPEYDSEDQDTLVNAQVVVEILSPSTERYDRGAKFGHYQQLPSVREYVLVSQDRKQVERFVRQPDETWVLTKFADPDGVFEFATVPIRIPMCDLYARVQIEEGELR